MKHLDSGLLASLTIKSNIFPARRQKDKHDDKCVSVYLTLNLLHKDTLLNGLKFVSIALEQSTSSSR